MGGIRAVVGFILVAFVSICFSNTSAAGGPPIVGRVFAGASNGTLTNVNDEIKSLGLEELGTIPMFGAELSYGLLPFFEVGINYTKKQNVRKTSATGADYRAEFDQNVFLAVARVPFLNTKVFRADIFAGVGGSNTTLKINSATQSGELTRRDDKEFVASLASRYGVSIAGGYNGFFLFAEGGYETNKADSLNRTGTLSSSIQSIDMSGPYALVGILIDGPQISSK